ncbi:TPA: hypothetical protein ACU6GO_002024 [Pseudomonas aeruginosa]|nr:MULTISPECIES: hypothetical protein [Pseudomonas]EKW6222670.1 hypothetical protein [Pseudomonas aeruginosa]ELK2664169.1 hypothetical protein [Pseudomonas aeruginosa]ELQ3328576.1 hypothetical protein [Pseudomonas aeruginosa]EMD8982717.1 hypothetical protein [Pseudomonas aeruginosa]EME0456137.1 hypothetical protein [Pseudomonas aeruginosa]
MAEPDISEVVTEAKKFRLKLECSKKANIRLITEDFPVMNCKLSSLLFTYHALQKWPSIVIYGVSGRAINHGGDDAISHYWLEYKKTAIDLTADQYNFIEEKCLNNNIIRSRPFKPVSTGRIGSMKNYKLFNIVSRDTYIYGLPGLAEDFLHDLHASYEALEGLAVCI